MNNYNYLMAVQQINAAPLPAPVYRTARRLLDIAHANATQPGYIEINRTQALEIAQTDAWNTVRGHLATLERNGLIQKWLNHSARIWWKSYPAPSWLGDQKCWPSDQSSTIADKGTHEIDHFCSPSDHFCSPSDQKCSPSDQKCSKTTYEILEREREREYIINTTEQSLSLSRNDLQPEQQRVFDALTDPEVNIQPANAIKVAQYMKLRLVLLMIGTWWPEREKYSAGALFKRLMNPGKFRPGVPGKDFLASEFYARHYPDDGVIDLPPPTRRPGAWGEGVLIG